jgi:hypothetical protein
MATLPVLHHHDRRSHRILRASRLSIGLAVAAIALALPAVAPGDTLRGSDEARAALAACLATDAAPPSERDALLRRAADVAERAVAANDRDAVAHFALFCAVGRRLELAGPSLSSLAEVRRLHAEVDRTLALEPDYVDAIVGKGAFLLRAPRLLGGDPVAGERLLRQAMLLAPDSVLAQLELARGLAANGDRARAESEAAAALESAVRLADGAREADARALIERLAR